MTEEAAPPIIQVVTIGVPPEALAIISKVFSESQIKDLPYDVDQLMELSNTTTPSLICCGPTPEGLSQIEVAQMLRMQFQDTSIFYLTLNREGFERTLLKKNGFSDAFLVPVDNEIFIQTLRDELSKATKGRQKSFRTVKLFDITPETELDFETYLYLPANKKYIKYTDAGGSLGADQTAKLKKHNFSNIHIEKQQMAKFYQYAAEKLKSIQGSSTISETEKKEKLQGAIRDIMGNMFSETAKASTTESGKQVVADCQEIVKAYVMSSTNNKLGWYGRLLSATGSSMNTYSHSANVSTYSALFALGIGMGVPENVALAGLLHDIGMTEVPPEIQLKSEEQMNEEELAIYKKHVEHTLNMIKSRKLIVSEQVIKIIAQHHERFDGRGFPKGTQGSRILDEAQIVSIADKFDYMTATVEGRPTLTPSQAIQKIYDITFGDPVNSPFNPEIVKKIVALFKPDES